MNHFYFPPKVWTANMKYVGKRGKMYMPDGHLEKVYIKEYRETWDEYFATYEGTYSGGFLVPARDMPSRFVEEKDYDHTCTCGSAKAGQPAHSHWCDSRYK